MKKKHETENIKTEHYNQTLNEKYKHVHILYNYLNTRVLQY